LSGTGTATRLTMMTRGQTRRLCSRRWH